MTVKCDEKKVDSILVTKYWCGRNRGWPVALYQIMEFSNEQLVKIDLK